MDANRPDLLALCFKHTFDADLLTFTCVLCHQGFVYTLHAPGRIIDADLTDHLRKMHNALALTHAWEEA